jgi:hypothetical protein
MVCSGLSEVIGSWKMIEIFSPRMFAHDAAGRLQQILAAKKISPRGMRGRWVGSSRRIDSAETVLPEPTRPPAPRSRPWAILRKRG